jgi:adenylate/nucleoside-diphosphate kinase
MSEPDVVSYLSSFDLEDGEPLREVGHWGRYCPVSFIEEYKLIFSDLNYPVSYRGRIYFLSSEENSSKFLRNPDSYLAKPPSLPSLNICVLGGPFTGKTSQSTLISKIYKLKLIRIEEILNSLDNEPDLNTLSNKNPTYAEIAKICQTGSTIPSELIVELIKMKISEESTDDTGKTKTTKTEGWVLDGFPRTVDDAKAMINAGIFPHHIIVLKNGKPFKIFFTLKN